MMLKIWLFRAFLPARFVLFALVICTCILSPVTVHALNQTEITAAMGAGWNLGNTMEANDGAGNPSETAWGNPTVTQELITAVKNAGFKTIRIPISFLNKIGAAPNYTIDAAWLARIKEVVDYAYGIGMYILIEVHGDGYESITGSWLWVEAGDQTAVKAKFGKVWQQLANTFINYDEHMIFESMNEVFDGNYYDPDPALYANLNAFNQVFVDTVRQTGGNNASRWLLIPGWNTNIDHTANDYGFVMPTDNYRSSSIPGSEKRIMISVHYYDPYNFTLNGSSSITQWGSIATDPAKVETWANEEWMEGRFNLMYYTFVTQGYPVVVGEYCATDKTNLDSTNETYRIYFDKTLCTYSKAYGAVPVYWDIGAYGPGASGLIDRKTYAIVDQGIIDGIMSGISANVTPAPAPTATPSPTGSAANIAILYKCTNTNSAASQIQFAFQVQNNDTVTVPLDSVTVKYWYVRDDGKWQSFNCYYAVVGSGNVYGNMVRIPLSQAFSTADFYAEVGFGSGAGSLSPGANSGEVQITLTKYDNSNYNQTNDYSFNSGLTAYGQNLKVTGYVNGILVFGTEPSGSSTTVAPTAAPTDISSTAAPTDVSTLEPTAAPNDTPAPTDVPTDTPIPTETPAPTTAPTATPVGVTAEPTGVTGDTIAPTTAPVDTAVPTTEPSGTTPPTGCTCANLCSSQTAITVPFTRDGAGEYCWTSSSLGSYANSWNADSVNINGTSCTNTYVTSSSIAAINGVYYIYYKASYSWSHIEIK